MINFRIRQSNNNRGSDEASNDVARRCFTSQHNSHGVKICASAPVGSETVTDM